VSCNDGINALVVTSEDSIKIQPGSSEQHVNLIKKCCRINNLAVKSSLSYSIISGSFFISLGGKDFSKLYSI